MSCVRIWVPVSVCVCMRVRVRVRRNVVERKGNAGENAKKGENVVRKEAEERGRECASATFILCCARKNVNYSKVRPAITYHLLLFQTIITVCSKCIIKKKNKNNYRYHEIKYSVRKNTKTYIIHYIPDVFSAEERWKICRVAVLWTKFVCQKDHCSFSLVHVQNSIMIWF